MTLLEGQKAPDFSLLNEKGEMVHLADFKRKNVILYFYPKDMTPAARRRHVIFAISLKTSVI